MATPGDILLSILIPFWGIAVGFIALCKGERKRAATLIAIGILNLLLSSLSIAHSGKNAAPRSMPLARPQRTPALPQRMVSG